VRTLARMWRLTALLVLVVATIAAATVPVSTAAAASCGRRVVDDWFDGRIDRTYAPHCYRDAIRLLPPDARAYTTAAGDIERAMLAAVRSYRRGGPGGGESAPAASRRAAANGRTLQAYRGPVQEEDAPFKRAAPVGSSENAAAVPLPILVLGLLTGLVVVAAGTNRLARTLRLRNRLG